MYSSYRGPRAKRRLPPSSRRGIVLFSDDDDEENQCENSVFDDPPIETKMEKVDWKNSGSDIVKLIVGSERKEFSIHKNFLCQASEVMKAAFCGEFAEGRSGVMTLVEDDASVVQNFITFCYPNFDRQALKEQQLPDLLYLYIFADKYRCPNSLKNIVMDSVQDKMRDEDIMIGGEWLKRIFENTTSTHEAPIRKYCAALLSFFFQSTPEDIEADRYHKVLLEIPDLQMAYLQYQRQVHLKSRGQCSCLGVPDSADADPRKRTSFISKPFAACYFHVHDGDETCHDSAIDFCPKHISDPAAGSEKA